MNDHDEAAHVIGPCHPLKSGDLIEIDPSNVVAPFNVRRVYWIFNTIADAVRGRHAHKELWQLLIVPTGRCQVTLEDRHGRLNYVLDSRNKGLLVGPGVWREMYDFSRDCVLTVLASQPYEQADYIRDYDEFKRMVP